MVRDSPPSNDWLVQVPLTQLVQLQSSLHDLEVLRVENKALSRRIDGLHRTVYDLIEIVGDLRRITIPNQRPA